MVWTGLNARQHLFQLGEYVGLPRCLPIYLVARRLVVVDLFLAENRRLTLTSCWWRQ